MTNSPTHASPWSPRATRIGFALIAVGALLWFTGSYIGLFRTPGEQYMGDVGRIMYAHVPTAWNAMLALTAAFGFALAFLFTGKWRFDNLLEATVEAGVVLCFLLCLQGAIWAKPTWGVWWDWDPRLTTMAVLLFLFLGILALRRFVDDPVRRATWSAVATIVAFVDVPIVYFSVKWWNSLHQQQSSPGTVSSVMHLPLRINAFAVLFLVVGLVVLRSGIAAMRLEEELGPPLPEPRDAGANPSSGPIAGGAR
jgi:heme exporter protein C